MTSISGLRRAAKAMKFRGGPSLWKPKVIVTRRSNGLEIKIHLPGAPVIGKLKGELQAVDLYDYTDVICDKRSPQRFLLDYWIAVMVHEAKESVLFNGKCVFDPHKR